MWLLCIWSLMLFVHLFSFHEFANLANKKHWLPFCPRLLSRILTHRQSSGTKFVHWKVAFACSRSCRCSTYPEVQNSHSHTMSPCLKQVKWSSHSPPKRRTNQRPMVVVAPSNCFRNPLDNKNWNYSSTVAPISLMTSQAPVERSGWPRSMLSMLGTRYSCRSDRPFGLRGSSFFSGWS